MTEYDKRMQVYDALVDTFGEYATNFMTNVFGMQICEDESVISELVDMGVLADEDEDECEDEEDEEDDVEEDEDDDIWGRADDGFLDI